MSNLHVVVVTGGVSGIGLGVCKLFAANGDAVAMLHVQEQVLARESAPGSGGGEGA